jgi:hypothetical protein
MSSLRYSQSARHLAQLSEIETPRLVLENLKFSLHVPDPLPNQVLGRTLERSGIMTNT